MTLHRDLLVNQKQVGQYLNDNNGTHICGEFLLKGDEDSRSLNILLKESEYFIRPNGYFVDRLDRLEKPSYSMDLYVTRYGNLLRLLLV